MGVLRGKKKWWEKILCFTIIITIIIMTNLGYKKMGKNGG